MNKKMFVNSGILVLITLGIFAYILNENKIDNNITNVSVEKPDNNIPIVSEESLIPETPTFNADISNWKTYRNEEYGFKFKYPQNWKGGETEFDLSELKDDNFAKGTGTVMDVGFGKDNFTDVLLMIRIMNKTIEEAAAFDHSSFGDKTGKATFIGGLKGEVLDGAFYGMQYVVKDGKTYFFEQINAENEQDRKDYDDVIKTFEFILPKAEMSGWKTYINEKYPYEIKYPPTWQAYDSNYNGEKHLENLYLQDFSRPEDVGYSGIGGTGCQLNVWVENEKYSSIQDWIDIQINNLGVDLEKISTREIQIGEMKAAEVTFSGSFLGSGDPLLIIINNETLYKISKYRQDVPQEKCQPVFDKIFSTFKVIR